MSIGGGTRSTLMIVMDNCLLAVGEVSYIYYRSYEACFFFRVALKTSCLPPWALQDFHHRIMAVLLLPFRSLLSRGGK